MRRRLTVILGMGPVVQASESVRAFEVITCAMMLAIATIHLRDLLDLLICLRAQSVKKTVAALILDVGLQTLTVRVISA